MKNLLLMLALCIALVGCDEMNHPVNDVRLENKHPEFPTQFGLEYEKHINSEVVLTFKLKDNELKTERELKFKCPGIRTTYCGRTHKITCWEWLQTDSKDRKKRTTTHFYKYSPPKDFETKDVYRVSYALNGHVYHRYTFDIRRSGDDVSFYDAETGSSVVVKSDIEIVMFTGLISEESKKEVGRIAELIAKRNTDIDEWFKKQPDKFHGNMEKYRESW